MRFKVTIEKRIIELLIRIKQDAYGEDAGRIRNAFILSKIILDRSYTKDEIDATLESLSEENYGNKMATTMNFNSKAYDKLKRMSEEFSCSMADILRATILIHYNKQDYIKAHTSKFNVLEELNVQFHDIQIKKVSEEKNQILKIFRLWDAKYKAKNGLTEEIIEECENTIQAKELYKKLGWGNFRYFDILHSFWKPFLCSAAIISSEENRPLFRFTKDQSQVEHDTALMNEDAYYITNIVKQYFVEPYMDYINKKVKHCNNRSNDKIQLMELLKNCYNLNNYAKLIYSPPNFSPVPDDRFNSAKGFVAHDSLSLLLEIIENYIREGKDLIVKDEKISVKDLGLWEKWFINNRENAMLEDYYFILDGKIITLKEFRTQSITHPLPSTKEELKEYFTVINTRALSRKQRMSERIASTL